jgi:hypothetical protein
MYKLVAGTGRGNVQGMSHFFFIFYYGIKIKNEFCESPVLYGAVYRICLSSVTRAANSLHPRRSGIRFARSLTNFSSAIIPGSRRKSQGKQVFAILK